MSLFKGKSNGVMTGRSLLLFTLVVLQYRCHTSYCHGWQFRFRSPNKKQDDPNHQPLETQQAKSQPGMMAHSPSPPSSNPPTKITRSADPSPFLTKVQNNPVVDQLLQRISDFLSLLYDRTMLIVLYKPPVGIVAFTLGLRLILTGRIFQLERPRSVQDMVMLKTKQSGRGRSLQLDPDDSNYRRLGGVDTVRHRLCEAVLTAEYANRLNNTDSERGIDQQNEDSLVEAVWQALRITHRPSGTLVDFLQQLVKPLSQVESLLAESEEQNASNKQRNTPSSNSSFNQALTVATLTLQVQAMDALLRLCRDRLVQATYRLARAKEYWDRVIRQPSNFRIWRRDDYTDELRIRLAHAQAVYDAEVRRLGRLEALILDRPPDMDQSFLLQALKASQEEANLAKSRPAPSKNETTPNSQGFNPKQWKLPSLPSTPDWQRFHPKQWKLPSLPTKQDWQRLRQKRWKIPSLSRYSLRWVGGSWALRKYDRSEGQLETSCATEALFTGTSDEWMQKARDWTQRARQLIDVTVQESLLGSGSHAHFTASEWAELEWSKPQLTTESEQAEEEWLKVLNYVNALSTWRRVGEGKLVRLKDAAIVHWTRRLDIMGIPSFCVSVWAANVFHKWIKPRWPQIQERGIEALLTAIDIWEARVWNPLTGIVDEIMNRSKSIMSALSLMEEEKSLDHMLRDMGFGDGTAKSRVSALEAATRQYEHDLKTGVYFNLARGRLVRLLLVQIQQLKVGLLSAVNTIDVLMKGNQIHLQILAAIPAILIATYGTRLFLRALYNIRARDLRPVTVVHGEMALYLDQMERLFLMADPVVNYERTDDEEESSVQIGRMQLSWSELGELLLDMHRYLVLLDFGSPPFPSRQCDQIHASLQDILGDHYKAKQANVAWLHTIQQKHKELLKSL